MIAPATDADRYEAAFLIADLLRETMAARAPDALDHALSSRGAIVSELDRCPYCAGDHDRIDRRDWDGCGEGCGPCPRTRVNAARAAIPNGPAATGQEKVKAAGSPSFAELDRLTPARWRP